MAATSRRLDIEGLRGVAACAVLVYHAAPALLPGGFMGVDIFFVISGYVVTLSLFAHSHNKAGFSASSTEATEPLMPLDDHSSTQLSVPEDERGLRAAARGVVVAHIADSIRCVHAPELCSFFARRFKRLAPTMTLVAACTSLATAMLVPADRAPRQPGEFILCGMLSLIGASNIFFAVQPHAGYFDRGQQTVEWNPFTHTWSLGVEEQFYLCFPLLIMLGNGGSLGLARRNSHALGKPHAHQLSGLLHARLLLVLSVACACSFLLCWRLARRDVPGRFWQQGPAFYLMPARLWQLCAGSLLCAAEKSAAFERSVIPSIGSAGYADTQGIPGGTLGTRLSILRSLTMEAAAASLLCLGLMNSPRAESLPLPAALAPVCGTLLFIAGGSAPRPTLSAGFCSLHASPLLNAALSRSPMTYLGKISYAVYLWHWPAIVLTRWAVGFDGMTTTLLVVAATFALAIASFHLVEAPIRRWEPAGGEKKIVHRILSVVFAVEIFLYLLLTPLSGKLYLAAAPKVSGTASAIRNFDVPLPYWQLGTQWANSVFRESECFSPGLSRQQMTACLTPTAAERSQRLRSLFVLGDSHAVHLVAGLREATRGIFAVKFASASFCHWTSPESIRAYVDRRAPPRSCELFVTHTWELLPKLLRPKDAVLVCNFVNNVAPSPGLASLYEAWLRRLSNVTAPRKAGLILVGDTPRSVRSGTDCAPRAFGSHAAYTRRCGSPANESRARIEALRTLLARVAALPGVYFFDPHRLLCDGDVCGPFVPGTQSLAIYDDHHLSDAGSLYLWPHLCSFLHDASLM